MLETTVLLRSIYRGLLLADTVNEARSVVKTIIGDDEAALVEKRVEEEINIKVQGKESIKEQNS